MSLSPPFASRQREALLAQPVRNAKRNQDRCRHHGERQAVEQRVLGRADDELAAVQMVMTSSSPQATRNHDPEDKVVLQARDDAASFVASDGRIRGAQLEAALRLLREVNADAQRASDMQLAQAILAL